VALEKALILARPYITRSGAARLAKHRANWSQKGGAELPDYPVDVFLLVNMQVREFQCGRIPNRKPGPAHQIYQRAHSGRGVL
jgi:hypothetical protein